MPKKKSKLPLSKTHPKLAREADGWDPALFTYGSNKKMRWRCSLGHKYESRIASRAISLRGCAICANQVVLHGFNDLLTLFPKVAKEADGWDPKTVLAGSHKKLQWKCIKNHSYFARPLDRTQQNTGCSICLNKKTLLGFNDLVTTHPEIAKEADGWDPTTLVAGSKRKMDWRCQRGHKYSATVSSRTRQKTNCPYCMNSNVMLGFNDLAFTHPEIAKEADGWDPTSVTAGSRRKMDWRCPIGHVYKSSVNGRTGKGNRGCIFCANQKVLKGFNDLATTHPEIAKEAHGWDPTTAIAGSGKRVLWKCPLGHTYNSSLGGRTSDLRKACPVCANQKVLKGFNDLATTHPEIAKEADGWDPTTVIAGSDKKRNWICNDGHKWSAHPNNRTSGNRGCPTCAKYGFDPNDNGFLYLLKHSRWHMLQVGITNNPSERLSDHKRLGWDIIETRGPMDGHLTQQWETAILRMLKAKGADLSNSKIAGKFDGYSEAWSKTTFPVKSLKELMRLTEEFEELKKSET